MARVDYDTAVRKLRAGDRVQVTYPLASDAKGRPAYTLIGGGYLTATTWDRLVPNLVPIPDGLFPDALPQTYAWTEG